MKSVQVSDEVHAELKSYCDRTGRKVGRAVEVAIKFWLSSIQAKKESK